MRWLPVLGLVAAFASCRSAGFKHVFTALDAQGNRKRSLFFTDTPDVFCVGELVSGRSDVTVTTVIRAVTLYDRRSDSMVPARGIQWFGEQAPGKTDDTFIAFRLEKLPKGDPRSMDDVPYPVGTFSCEMSIDGQLEDSAEFAITFPDCPKLPPVPDQPCLDWVRPDSRCPGATGLECLCDATSGTWRCAE